MVKDSFQNHLDKCKQCRENPFDLCPKGLKLFHQQVKVLLITPNPFPKHNYRTRSIIRSRRK